MKARKKLTYKGYKPEEYLPFHNFRVPTPGFDVFPGLYGDWQQVLCERVRSR